MVTQKQLDKKAIQRFGCNYLDLTGPEKATVSRELHHTGGWTAAQASNHRTAPSRKTPVPNGGGICKFLRFGSNGVKEVPFIAGATLQKAYDQQKNVIGGIRIDPTKEGFQDRETGTTVMFNDKIKNGQELVATVGISSA